jgi:hypothetical protein
MTIQQPEQKTGVALVFMGSQGGGKGTLWEYWGNVMIGKKYYLITESLKDVVGEGFNDAKQNKLLVLIDESDAKDQMVDGKKNKMKNYITNTTQTIRKKFKDTETNCKDYANIVFLSNEYVPVVIEESDRRHVVFKTSNKFCTKNYKTSQEEKREFWERVYRYLDKEKPCPHTAVAVREYFKRIDLTGFNAELDRPLTEAYNSVKRLTMPNELKFLEDYSTDVCSRIKDESMRSHHAFYISGVELYRYYKEWHEDFNPQGKPCGKTTLEGKWKNYDFMCLKLNNKNVKYYAWSQRKLQEYLRESGYAENNADIVDEQTHTSLLMTQQQVP